MADIYYVTKLDSKSREIPFSRIECEDAIDAADCEAFMIEQNPKLAGHTMIGYIPDPLTPLVPHVCRGCNCQFDRRGALIQ